MQIIREKLDRLSKFSTKVIEHMKKHYWVFTSELRFVDIIDRRHMTAFKFAL